MTSSNKLSLNIQDGDSKGSARDGLKNQNVAPNFGSKIQNQLSKEQLHQSFAQLDNSMEFRNA